MSGDQYQYRFELQATPFARKILTILRYIARELDTPYSGDDLLFKILHYDFYQISPAEIIRVSIRATEKKQSLRQYLQTTRHLTLFTEAPEQALMDLATLLESWIRAAQQNTPQQLITRIINESDIVLSPGLTEVLQVLSGFIQRNPEMPLVTLMDNMTLMKQQQIPEEPRLAPEIAPADPLFTDGLLASFVMSVTALNNYLDCPLGFYYKHLLRIPSGRSENMAFGSAVHFALEKLFQQMQDHPQQAFPSLETLTGNFSRSMHDNREAFTRASFPRRMEDGQAVLAQYYHTYLSRWNKVVSIERNIRVLMNGVPLRGKVDKLEFEGSDVNVVDYKTGDYEKTIGEYHKFDRPSAEKPHGGDYWRQAVFYKILLDNYRQKNWRVVSTEFDFVEPNKQGVYHKEKVIITPQDMTTVTQQIQQTWTRIQQKDFYTGCGKPDCPWCNFVKDNQLQVALHDPINLVRQY